MLVSIERFYSSLNEIWSKINCCMFLIYFSSLKHIKLRPFACNCTCLNEVGIWSGWDLDGQRQMVLVSISITSEEVMVFILKVHQNLGSDFWGCPPGPVPLCPLYFNHQWGSYGFYIEGAPKFGLWFLRVPARARYPCAPLDIELLRVHVHRLVHVLAIRLWIFFTPEFF